MESTFNLYNADCLEKMKDIPDNSVDLIICDLPYGCLSTKNKEEGCAWDIKINLEDFWKQVKRIRKDDHTPCIHFCSTKFGYDLIKSNEAEFRHDLVWCKSNAVGFLLANKKPMNAHEMIYVFSKKGANYNRIDLINADYPAGGGGISNAQFIPSINGMPNSKTTTAGRRCVKSYITEIPNKKTKGGHPTAKPQELYKWLIERYSNVGDTILDPTFGSCNSGIVARELGRSYIGIEKDKGFFDKANDEYTVLN